MPGEGVGRVEGARGASRIRATHNKSVYDMTIHECARCDGCGYVTGLYRWEIPWSEWAAPAGAQEDEAEDSFLTPHVCPDCGGTGALLELPVTPPTLTLASRRGIRSAHPYAEHVALVLQMQSMRATAN